MNIILNSKLNLNITFKAAFAQASLRKQKKFFYFMLKIKYT
jgi:hypothetical protein